MESNEVFDQFVDRSMSRRAFVALAGVAAVSASTGLIGCTPSEEPVQDETAFDEGVNDETPEIELSPEELLEIEISDIIAGFTLEQKVAQLFLVRPEPVFGGSGLTAVGEGFLDAYRQYPVAGFALFAANLSDTDQATTFLADLAAMSEETVGVTPFLAVDEEGGLVARVAGNSAFGQTNVGDMSDIGATGDVQAAADAAAYIASYLAPLGFNMDFAPVCDISSGTGLGMMDQRAFSDDVELVSAMASAQVKEFEAAGILACAKHFPGIGAGLGDTHDGSVYLESTLDDLRAREFLPFEAVIEAGASAIMVGHVSLPTVLADEEKPGIPVSLSPTVITGILREELGYDGVVLTDALEMGAVVAAAEGEDPALLSIEAGCDLALIPSDFKASYAAVLEAVQSGRLTEARVDESLRRTLRARLSLR